MKSLLLVAHGSRRKAFNGEIRPLAGRLRAAADSFDHLACAFLKLAEPSNPDGLRLKLGAANIRTATGECL